MVDVDGNSLIDLGSEIAVTTVGNSNPRVAEAVAAQVEAFTHPLHPLHRDDGSTEVLTGPGRDIPGPDEDSMARVMDAYYVQLGHTVLVSRQATRWR